jgi:transposase-like protein
MPKAVHQLTSAQFDRMFPVDDEDACKAYLKARRWPKGVVCPRCGNTAVYDLPSRKWHWQCEKCAKDGYRFSVIAGTIFENTNKPLRDWFKVAHLMLTSKKGMSSRQIGRYMGFGSVKTAWLMGHKIRTALVEEDMDKLGGIVEVDETYVGGKAHNKHGRHSGVGGGSTGKAIIIGAVKRKGNVVARVIERANRETLEKFVKSTVSERVSLLCTDAAVGYYRLGYRMKHGVVDHRIGQYAVPHVVGVIHTNTIEGFWSMIKRGIVGSFHKVSKKYLPLYVAEFQFRYNNRMNDDIFGAAIGGC